MRYFSLTFRFRYSSQRGREVEKKTAVVENRVKMQVENSESLLSDSSDDLISKMIEGRILYKCDDFNIFGKREGKSINLFK